MLQQGVLHRACNNTGTIFDKPAGNSSIPVATIWLIGVCADHGIHGNNCEVSAHIPPSYLVNILYRNQYCTYNPYTMYIYNDGKEINLNCKYMDNMDIIL